MSWKNYFLTVSIAIASKSKDPNTKCGCVITYNNEIVSTGFNGPVRNCNDSLIPNTRPLKYFFYLHSEINAIFFAKRDLQNCIAYVSGKPCINCLQCLYHTGIREIYYTDWSKPKISEDQSHLYDIFLSAITDKLIFEYIPWNTIESE